MARAYAAVMTEWQYDDPGIDDQDRLFRRVPKVPGCQTYDPSTETYAVSPGGLRRESNDGMSSHLQSVIELRGRDAFSLYNEEKYSSIRFGVAVPRGAGAGVLPTPAPEEPDEDLRAAHAEVRPPMPEYNKVFWKNVANVIAESSEWVQGPGHVNPNKA
jgi:hypothetical protein